MSELYCDNLGSTELLGNLLSCALSKELHCYMSGVNKTFWNTSLYPNKNGKCPPIT